MQEKKIIKILLTFYLEEYQENADILLHNQLEHNQNKQINSHSLITKA